MYFQTTTEHPGDWQQYATRPSNKGLNVMELRKRYLLEYQQYEQQVHGLVAMANSTGAGRNPNITIQDILDAQGGWSQAVIDIGTAYGASGAVNATNAGYINAASAANYTLSTLYNYDYGDVFFRPTLTVTPNTFRNTKARALSYFVGYTSALTPGGVTTDTTGFATANRWGAITFNNYPGGTAGPGIGINIVSDTLAFTMGYVTFSQSAAGSPDVTVDKTFGYYKDPVSEVVRIVLHISALTNSNN